MPQPFTIRHGSWSPDMANVAVQIPYQYTATEVPSADCLNVYYQDAAFRCLPAPAPFGPAAAVALLNAFTYYDDVANQEIVFGATEDGAIYALIDGVWQPITVETETVVQGVGVSATFSLASTVTGASLTGTFRLGFLPNAAKGQLYNGILGAALINPVDDDIGFVSGSGGSLSPPQDFDNGPGTPIALHTFGSGASWYLQLEYAEADIIQNYFSTLIVAGMTFASSAASYIAVSPDGTTIWNWPFGSNPGLFMPGANYPVVMNF